MCGIVAIVTSQPDELEQVIRAMNETIVHRGPDDSGEVVLAEDGVALAMRRLSILDVEGGHQPMWDERREHCVVFNGEIYNFAELRSELEALGHQFQTDHSDTEVIVHGFEQWGSDLLPRLNGMFALAIWNRDRRELTVARDRTGQKPLYVARLRSGFAVASELKAFFQHPEFKAELDPIALEQYLAFDFVISPRTMLKGVEKIPPAHFARITPERIDAQRYWMLSFDPQQASDEDHLVAELDERLASSVQQRMVADVPVGLFLSGGLDSTAIGYYARQFSDDVHSFSVGFDDPRYDESQYAQMASAHLGTHHHAITFGEDRIPDLVSRMPDILDEPMGDASIFPTHVLSQFAQQHVKVALGGDGSDEFLMGYGTYPLLRELWTLDRLPMFAKKGVEHVSRYLLSHMWRASGRGRLYSHHLPLTPQHRLLSLLGAFGDEARSMLSPEFTDGASDSEFQSSVARMDSDFRGQAGGANRTISAYVSGYLTEDILVKVDRASMATSLEVRSPFLDPDCIEFYGRVPNSMKLHGTTRKYLLRKLMRGRIPDAIIDREKQGFGIPLDDWMRSSLAPMLEEHLRHDRLTDEGVFDPQAVSALVQEHRNGTANRGRELWLLLQFQLWSARWLNQ